MITTLPKWPRPSKWWYASFASANRNVRSITGCKRCIVIARFIASKSARLPTLIEPRVMPRPVSNKGSSPARLRQACTNQADMSPHSQRLQRHRDRPRPADLDDAIDAAAIGQLTRLRVPIRRFDVVDHLRCPQCLQPLGFFRCRGCRNHSSTQDLGELQGKVRDAPRALGQNLSPAVTRRWSVSATQAVTAAQGRVAASSKDRWLGRSTTASSLKTAYSASIPSRLAPSRSVK